MNKTVLVLLVVSLAVFALCSITSLALAADENTQPSESNQAQAPVTVPDENYLIAEEDVLRMDIWGERDFSGMQMRVTRDGKINVPYLGEMQAAGLTQSVLTSNIAKKLEEADIIYNAKVQITIVTLHEPIVRVLGQVNRPGPVIYKDGDTVIDAVASAGSFTDNAMLEKATLTHKGSDKPILIDLQKIFRDNDLTQNFELQKGDTIYIPPEDYQNKVYVLGQVARPGLYDLKDKTTVLQVITLAGGQTERGALKSTMVVRGDPAKPEKVKCDLTRLFDKADLSQDIELKPGDVVIVPESKTPNWNKISQILSTVLNLTYLRRTGIF